MHAPINVVTIMTWGRCFGAVVALVAAMEMPQHHPLRPNCHKGGPVFGGEVKPALFTVPLSPTSMLLPLPCAPIALSYRS
jgi:hypothetical protein